MKHFLLITSSIFALIFTTGCSVTPKYKVTIDAIKAPNITINPDIYSIESLDSKKDANGLKFQKQANILAQMLHEKGYLTATEGEITKQTIYFDYGLEKVQEETETYTQPDVTFHVGWGYPYYGGYYGRHYSPFFYDNFYGGGYSTYRRTRTYYNRYITLLAKDPFQKELWRVDVSSVGESKNLRKIIPILIKAAKPYIGTNTAEPVNIVIKDEAKQEK